MIEDGAIKILTPNGALPRAEPTDGMTTRAECWYARLSAEAAGNDDGDQIRRVRVLRVSDVLGYDMAVIDGMPYMITRIFQGVDDESGEEISDLTLMTGPRVFAAVTLIPATAGTSGGFSAEQIDTAASKATVAEIRSVTSAEYNEAQASGVELAFKAMVYAVEYNDQPYLSYGGKTYGVRQKRFNGQRVELYCARR